MLVDDLSLIAAATSGDRASQERVLRQVMPRVRGLVRSLLGSDSGVDDATQLALLEILQSLKGYREGSFGAWCDRITVRTALRLARRQRLRASRETAEELEVMDSQARPDDYLYRRQAVHFLDKLPSEQRAAVVLHHVLGFTVNEIAEQEGVPIETLRSRLRNGVARLRDVSSKDWVKRA
ncbi:MAG: hypothetical protein RJA70_2081 [Pseudomonadota bacterium]|jgi:RNA polymerase sigma-70 factor (ECF subfamily)